MMEHEFRRLPITDPGSGKLLGIVTVMDILDLNTGTVNDTVYSALLT